MMQREEGRPGRDNMNAVQENAKENKDGVARGLSTLLADTYILYLKTQNFHWNVKGPQFQALHLLFEQQYNELAAANDLIAERIRALGQRAPASFAEFSKMTAIKESTSSMKAQEMIRQLLADNETLLTTANKAFPAAEEAEDQASMDLLTQRLQAHGKAAWMLRSLLEE
jgi:starvation-inducible DNA-binding protein